MEDKAVIILELLSQAVIALLFTDVSFILGGLLTWFRESVPFQFGDEDVRVSVHALLQVWVVVLKKLLLTLYEVLVVRSNHD